MSKEMDNEQAKVQTSVNNKPASNERVPGQGNSSDGLTRRLGSDLETRGEKEVEKLQKREGIGEEHRVREGSQGGSKGQA